MRAYGLPHIAGAVLQPSVLDAESGIIGHGSLVLLELEN